MRRKYFRWKLNKRQMKAISDAVFYAQLYIIGRHIIAVEDMRIMDCLGVDADIIYRKLR